jgi:hypothetical protein
MRSLILAFLLIFLPLSALAAPPSEIGAYIKSGTPYGSATLNKFMSRVYDATLWTDAPEWTMKKPFALSLRYGMNFDGEDLARRSIEEMDSQKKLAAKTAAAWGAKLRALFPDVKKGDRITAVYLPDRGTRIYYNGAYRGSISDTAFSARFIGIWMSPETSEPAVRKKLIGKK